MREFIFTWNIENISHSWHKKGEPIVSPSFVADTLQNTVWRLCFYPRGLFCAECLSLYLKRVDDEGQENYHFLCELSCVSANNLPLISKTFGQKNSALARDCGVGYSKFLRRQEVFVSKKDLYLPQDTLKLRCKIWRYEGGVDKFGQCFGSNRLEIERAISYKVMNPRINNHTKVSIISIHRKTLLISIDVLQQKDGLKITLHTTKNSNKKFSTFKFLAVGKNRQTCEFVTSWFVRPYLKVWRSRFLKFEKLVAINNKLKITCEFTYATGEETQSIEKVNTCSYKFPEFSSDSIICCIPSGKLSDCPSICKDLWDLHEKQILCDVELKTETTSFFVHKTVLCARSPVFLAMFTHNMKERLTNCVEIKDLEDDTLEKLVKFLYTDSFEETEWDRVLKLYYAADKYQLTRLRYFCFSYFKDNIAGYNVSELLLLADKHNDSDLNSILELYFNTRSKWIFRTDMWKQFKDEHPLLAWRTRRSRLNKRGGKEIPTKSLMLISDYNTMGDFTSLYHSQSVSDIVIQTRTATFPAHKIMLCVSSSRMREMFIRSKSTNRLKMLDLDNDTVSRLLLFLYTDSLGDIDSETATNLYHASVVYQIERLKMRCSCYFVENFCVYNASYVLQLAQEHGDAKLKSLAKDFLSLREWKISVAYGLAKFGETDVSERLETRLSKRLRLENDAKDK